MQRTTQILGVALAAICLVSSSGLMAAEKAKKEAAAKKSPKRTTLASISIAGGFPESAGGGGLFGETSTGLRDLVVRLHNVANDEKISGVVLSIRDASLGFGKLNELKSAVARIRAKGKKVYALVDSATGSQYQLACACDEIIMPPSGSLMIPGLSVEITFYKGLFDKLGIEADMLQIGKYKGAAEPQTRTGMSKEFRSQYEAVIDDYYEQMVASIADARLLHPKKVKELIDRGLFSAKRAKKAGLIDHVMYQDEFFTQLKKKLQVDEVALVQNYGKKKVDTDFSGLAGMMKMMELIMGGKPAKRASSKPKVAIVYAVGIITSGRSSTSIFGEQTLGSSTIISALRKANKDKTVRAIVLRVDSPGGSALASDLIWREIERIKKPVIASMGNTAASGGYYISMGCDQIIAEPGTLTGSIGVVGGKLVLGGLYAKLGITTETISRGKHAGAFSSTTKFTDSERKMWREMMVETYNQFAGKAAKGRKMTRKKMETLAQGRVWTGRMAAKNGLVDRVGTLQDAIAAAKKAAGIKADDEVEILVLPKPTSFFEQLLGGGAEARSAVTSELGAEIRKLSPELHRQLGDIETIRRLFAEPSVLMLPYRVEIK
ncbi:MAG: signal peptide peptidase SppA [Planctomycetes bacterium]|nr:signal peptide peptidase SppA [Planctomycetota bacterium]